MIIPRVGTQTLVYVEMDIVYYALVFNKVAIPRC